MSELINLSLTDQILGLTDKSFSSKEITRAYLNEIKKKESLNCFISVFEEESEEKALVADENIAKNKARPLEGIPIAHKDIFCIQDKNLFYLFFIQSLYNIKSQKEYKGHTFKYNFSFRFFFRKKTFEYKFRRWQST